jgi:hypothetical protein
VASKGQWVLLAYRIPREPSTPRIAVWRRLRQLGAVQLGDGLAALPLDDDTREQFEWLAQFIEDASGEAAVWLAEPTTGRQHRELVERVKQAVAADYRTVVEAAGAAQGGDPAKRSRTVLRLRRTLDRIRARDYFGSPERRRAEQAVADLAAIVEARR